MSLQEMREKLATSLDEAKKVSDAAKAESRDLTDDESEKINQLLDDADNTKAQIAKSEASAALVDRVESSAVDVRRPAGRKSHATAGTHNQNINVTVKDNIADDPNKGFKTPAEFVMAVMETGRTHKISHEGLKFLATAGSDEHGTYADPYGGFLVPEGFSPTLMSVSPEADPTASRVTRIPMSSPTVKIPARVDKTHTSSVSGGLTVGRNAEAIAATTSRMSFEKITLEATKLTGATYVTDELMTDSPITFASLISQGFADEFASTLLDERINGVGAGQFIGAMTSGCLVTVAKELLQLADTITYPNIYKMRAQCWRYGDAIWLANHDTLPQLVTLNQAIGTAGVAVWQPSAREDVPDVLMGRPIYFSEYMKTVGDLGDILLGNWSQYLEGTLQPLQGAESIHVRFLEGEKTLKFTMRNAGAPWWSSALTPKNSTTTLSPFVTLAARA